jgi:lysophospholipase L1-like esterase
MKLQTKLNLSIVSIVFLIVSPAFCQTSQLTPNQPPVRPINMLVLGDSIMWGQGLKPDHKPSYHVKVWLEKTTRRTVIERIEAHSGAVIEGDSVIDKRTSTDREVNLGLPTLLQQLDSALRAYSDGSQIDLVLLSGCGNDVGFQTMLNASTIEEVADMTREKCGGPMEELLRRITTSFPAAEIIVIGYYPFFSEHTRNDFLVRALARRFFKTQPGAPKISSKEVFKRLEVNSKQWYETSNQTLAQEAQKINVEIGRQRVMFARIEFPPDYSFAAPRTRLWNFNRSPFRMALVLLSFGRILLPSNDEVRRQRTASCDEVFKKQPNETPEQKKERKALRLSCRYAALGHPNRQGALLYADAITNILQSTGGIAALRAP